MFTMTFQSVETPFKMWSDPDRVKRYSSYFGPNVTAKVLKIDSDKRIVGIELTTYSGDKPPEPEPAIESQSATSEISESETKV